MLSYLAVGSLAATLPAQFPAADQTYLKASNTDPGDQFAAAVTVWGDTLVVGAPLEDSSGLGVDGTQFIDSAMDSGAAYVFLRDGTSWIQQA